MDMIKTILNMVDDVYVALLNEFETVCVGDVDAVREFCVKEKKKNPENRYRVLKVPGINRDEKAIILDYLMNNRYGTLSVLLKTGTQLKEEIDVLHNLGFGGELNTLED